METETLISQSRAAATRLELERAMNWVEECKKLGWSEATWDKFEALWWEHHVPRKLKCRNE